MRETKFRAWDSNNETMIYSSEEGAVFTLEKGECSVKYVREKNMVNGEIEVDAPVWQEAEEIEVMLFTGLLDWNGKEIYEGDIVKSFDKIGKVRYHSERAAFIFNDGFNELLFEKFPIEIIGNIYSNPELIKQTV